MHKLSLTRLVVVALIKFKMLHRDYRSKISKNSLIMFCKAFSVVFLL